MLHKCAEYDTYWCQSICDIKMESLLNVAIFLDEFLFLIVRYFIAEYYKALCLIDALNKSGPNNTYIYVNINKLRKNMLAKFHICYNQYYSIQYLKKHIVRK